MYLHNLLSKILIKSNEYMPKKNINIQKKHIRECNWNNKKHIFTKIFS